VAPAQACHAGQPGQPGRRHPGGDGYGWRGGAEQAESRREHHHRQHRAQQAARDPRCQQRADDHSGQASGQQRCSDAHLHVSSGEVRKRGRQHHGDGLGQVGPDQAASGQRGVEQCERGDDQSSRPGRGDAHSQTYNYTDQ
jgi:hypothetical protein